MLSHVDVLPSESNRRTGFVCPECRGLLDIGPSSWSCASCEVVYPLRGGQPDLRPRRPISRTLTVRIDAVDTPLPTARLAPLERGPHGEGTTTLDDAVTSGNRLSAVLATRVPPSTGGQVMLDVGCGDTLCGRALASGKGYEYVGVDIGGDEADALVDAHVLPFVDGAVGVVCSWAVLEHLRMPHLAVEEIHRVLAPDGVFVGSVAFLEPFHMDSHFHHTHLGLADVLAAAGFVDIQIEANDEWRVTDAVYWMHHLARHPAQRRTARFAQPLLRALSRTSRRDTNSDTDHATLAGITGGFRFVARRPS